MPTRPRQVVLSNAELGERLRAVRLRKGLTQQQLAEAIGSHFTAISAVECGRRALTLQQAVKLATALHVSPDELLHPKHATPRAPDTRSERQLMRRLQRIQELPQPQQRTVLDVLDSLLKAQGRNGLRGTAKP